MAGERHGRGMLCVNRPLTTRFQSRGLFRAKGKGDRGVEWNAYGILVGKHRKEIIVGSGRTWLGELYRILGQHCILLIGTSGGLLWRRSWTVAFHNARGISWLLQVLFLTAVAARVWTKAAVFVLTVTLRTAPQQTFHDGANAGYLAPETSQNIQHSCNFVITLKLHSKSPIVCYISF